MDLLPHLLSLPHFYPRRLSSFPTRRSSDLALLEDVRGRLDDPLQPFAIVHLLLARFLDLHDVEEARQQQMHYREGLERVKIGRATSELQSQSNIVCRLLLEKKK